MNSKPTPSPEAPAIPAGMTPWAGAMPDNLASLIEVELNGWKGANGGIFAVRAAAYGVAIAVRAAMFRESVGPTLRCPECNDTSPNRECETCGVRRPRPQPTEAERVAVDWVLVPRKPTAAMLEAALERWDENVAETLSDECAGIWSAMLTAAPEQFAENAKCPSPAPAPDGEVDRLRQAVTGIADDCITSERHHPGHVLIPKKRFDAICAALNAGAGK